MKKTNLKNGLWVMFALLFSSLFFTSAITVTKEKTPPASVCLMGEVKIFPGDFAPRNWALCHGQMLSSTQNQALVSIIGNTYGGDYNTTFALPDLRGRAPIHIGTSPGLKTITLGEKGGTEKLSATTVAVEKGVAGQNNVTTASGDVSNLSNLQPSMRVNYIICINGDYPSRS